MGFPLPSLPSTLVPPQGCALRGRICSPTPHCLCSQWPQPRGDVAGEGGCPLQRLPPLAAGLLSCRGRNPGRGRANPGWGEQPPGGLRAGARRRLRGHHKVLRGCVGTAACRVLHPEQTGPARSKTSGLGQPQHRAPQPLSPSDSEARYPTLSPSPQPGLHTVATGVPTWPPDMLPTPPLHWKQNPTTAPG